MRMFGAEVSGSGTWWTIFSCMASAITGLFVWAKKLQADLTKCQEARISSLEEKVAMVRAAKDQDKKP